MTIAVVVGALAPVGVAAVGLTRRQHDERPPLRQPARSAAAADGLRVTPLAGWSISAEAPSIPGMSASSSIVVAHGRSEMQIVAADVPATSPALLPADLLRRLAYPPDTPESVRLGGRVWAYHYGDLSLPGPRGRVEMYVVPTTEGVATLGCSGVTASADACSRTADTLRITKGRPLDLTADAAFKSRLAGEIRTVDDVRERSRRQLTQATTRTEQSAATLGVSLAYRQSAATLTPLAQSSPPLLAIVAQLRGNAAIYHRISTHLDAQDTDAVARDRDVALDGEARLKALLAGQG